MGIMARRRVEREKKAKHEAAKHEARASNGDQKPAEEVVTQPEAKQPLAVEQEGVDGVLDSGAKQDSADPGLRGKNPSSGVGDLQQNSKRQADRRSR